MVQFAAIWADGIQVTWRALSWSEYRKFRERMLRAPMGASLDIYQTVVVDGPELDQLPAGIARFIADHVLVQNPFSGRYKDVKRSLDLARQKQADTFLISAKALVCHMLHYKVEEIEAWDADTFFERLAMAEFIAGKRLETSDPEAKPDPTKKPKRPKKALTGSQALALDRVRDARRGA